MFQTHWHNLDGKARLFSVEKSTRVAAQATFNNTEESARSHWQV
jgi:hypothetical protein